MADTMKRLFTGTLTNVSATVYTVPALTKTIITEIILANKTAGAVVATVKIGSEEIIAAKSIPANDSIVVKLYTLCEAGEIVSAFAGVATSINLRMSGVEVT